MSSPSNLKQWKHLLVVPNILDDITIDYTETIQTWELPDRISLDIDESDNESFICIKILLAYNVKHINFWLECVENLRKLGHFAWKINCFHCNCANHLVKVSLYDLTFIVNVEGDADKDGKDNIPFYYNEDIHEYNYFGFKYNSHRLDLLHNHSRKSEKMINFSFIKKELMYKIILKRIHDIQGKGNVLNSEKLQSQRDKIKHKFRIIHLRITPRSKDESIGDASAAMTNSWQVSLIDTAYVCPIAIIIPVIYSDCVNQYYKSLFEDHSSIDYSKLTIEIPNMIHVAMCVLRLNLLPLLKRVKKILELQ